MKICLSFSAGGHHYEMSRLMSAFDGHEYFFVTIRKASTENLEKVYYIKDTMGPTILHMLMNMVMNTLQSLRVLILERPRIIVSTGADVTIPICYVGKLLGMKIVYIESIARVNELSFGGKMIYPISDLFLVQWSQLAKRYERARYWGQVL